MVIYFPHSKLTQYFIFFDAKIVYEMSTKIRNLILEHRGTLAQEGDTLGLGQAMLIS